MNAVEIESAISELAARFKNDTERLEKLFELYTKMTAAEKSKPAVKAAKGRKKTS